MTTLHRKPRGTSEQPGADAKYFHTAVSINETDAVDSNSEKSHNVSESSRHLYRSNSISSSSPGSSKGRRSNKYIRRGLYSSSGSSYSGGGSSPSSKKMSTLQLRTFFAVCVLLYFCALFFAQEIVSFGKFVNSEQTRQKIFSQWKPMHSAASQYLRAAMTEPEVVRDEKRDVDFVKAADASELPKSDEEKDGDDKAVSEEQDVPSPATHHVDASAAPASYEPSLNPPQEAPPTAHTQDQEHREPEHEKAAETHKHGERAPPPISVTPEDHQDAEDDSGAAATMDENSSQVPLDAENRHREPDYLSREPQQKDEVERAHHPVATDLHRAANEPTLHEKTDRDADDSTITHANNVNPSNNPPIISRNERESTVVRTAEAESQNAPTDTAAAAAAIPSLAHTDEPAHSPPSAPPSKPIELDDVSAAPVPVRGDEGAADAMKESEKQVTASATPATEARANEEENGGHETQDGFHHYHLDEAR